MKAAMPLRSGCLGRRWEETDANVPQVLTRIGLANIRTESATDEIGVSSLKISTYHSRNREAHGFAAAGRGRMSPAGNSGRLGGLLLTLVYMTPTLGAGRRGETERLSKQPATTLLKEN